MENIKFLRKYKVSSGAEENSLSTIFYPLRENDIKECEEKLNGFIPKELKEIFTEIGYGFINKAMSSINRLMDPFSISQINLKEDFYEFDPDLEVYDELYNGDKLLFFEVNEGIYLAIDKKDKNGKNAIYYFDKKISDSLEDFLVEFDKNPNLIEEIEI